GRLGPGEPVGTSPASWPAALGGLAAGRDGERGGARGSPSSFIRASQVIDGVIQKSQPAFGFVWIGSVLSLVAAAVMATWKLASHRHCGNRRWQPRRAPTTLRRGAGGGLCRPLRYNPRMPDTRRGG